MPKNKPLPVWVVYSGIGGDVRRYVAAKTPTAAKKKAREAFLEGFGKGMEPSDFQGIVARICDAEITV